MTTLEAPEVQESTARPTALHHDHRWATESAHNTSEGRVSYRRCDECGVRRVELAAFRRGGHGAPMSRDIVPR